MRHLYHRMILMLYRNSKVKVNNYHIQTDKILKKQRLDK